MTAPGGRGPAVGEAHRCPVAGCRARVPYHRLMCKLHWYQVPRPLRDAVWATWQSGAGAGTAAHTAAIEAAVRAVDGKANTPEVKL